ncbi:hypothetical protein [Hoeflea sp.]|uniref:hypothetical protein n=1 Tax=Hoeflea sp. TaxID=1940281 RepID=UPI003A92084D
MSFRRDFVADLPVDPDDALIELADRASAWLDEPQSPDDNLNRAYVTQILERFIDRYRPEIQEYISETNPNVRDIIEAIVRFGGTREVDRLLDDYERVVQDTDAFGVASLTGDEKKELHSHLENVRQIIQESPLGDRKKNALFSRLNALIAEVDSISTRTDRFFAFAGDISFVLGEMAGKAKPFVGEVKDILKIIRGSRARTENVQLPHEETLTLPSPDSSSQEDTH